MRIEHTLLIAFLVLVCLAPSLRAAALSIGPATPAAQIISPGQSATIKDPSGASGGSGSYTYQWLEEAPGATSFSPATDCGAVGNAPHGFPVDCSFSTTSTTPTGIYNFEYQVNDGGTPIVSTPAAVTVSFLTTSYNTFQQWLPVVVAAILLGFMIAALIYMGGSFLGIDRIKSMGLHEFGQALGTLVMTVIIIAVFAFLGSASVAFLASSTIGQGLDNVCTQNIFAANTPLQILSGSPTGPYTQSGTICNFEHTAFMNAQSGNPLTGDITPYLDYNLVNSYVIIANLTNQTVDNLNSLYIYEGLTGFLSQLTSETGICEAGPLCSIPLKKDFDVYLLYQPLAGYTMLNTITSPVETQAVFIFYMFMIQMLFALVFLFAWPYLLAIGIVLRSIVFTRKIGGLLMAAAVVGVAIFPIIYTIEYAVLQGGGNSIPIIGTNPTGLPRLTLLGKDFTNPPGSSGDWNSAPYIIYDTGALNFYVFPKIKFVLFQDGCWPTYANLPPPLGDGHRHATDLTGEELYDSSVYLDPFYPGGGWTGAVLGTFVTRLPVVPTMCTPDAAIQSAFDLTNIYGVIAIAGYVLPLLNVLIALSALKNVSALFGGETELVGIGRLV